VLVSSLLTLCVGCMLGVAAASAAAADPAPPVVGGADEFDDAPAAPLVATDPPGGAPPAGGAAAGGAAGAAAGAVGGLASLSPLNLLGRLAASGASGGAMHLDAAQVWWFERVVLALCAAYVGVFLYGRSVNERVVAVWSTTLTSAVEGEFAAVGVDAVGTKIHKDGQGIFHFYASGRRHVSALTCTLSLKRRFDLFTLLQTPIARGDVDQCSLLLTLPDEDGGSSSSGGGGRGGGSSMEPLMWALVRRREVKRFRRANRVLEALAGQVPSPAGAWAQPFLALADQPETGVALLPPSVAEVLSALAPWLFSLHVTDCGVGNVQAGASKRAVEMVVEVPAAAPPAEVNMVVTAAVRLVLWYADFLPNVRLPPPVRQRAVAVRADWAYKEAEPARLAAAEARQAERDAAAEREAAQRSPAAQLKHEEKMRKKGMRKRQGGRVMVMR